MACKQYNLSSPQSNNLQLWLENGLQTIQSFLTTIKSHKLLIHSISNWETNTHTHTQTQTHKACLLIALFFCLNYSLLLFFMPFASHTHTQNTPIPTPPLPPQQPGNYLMLIWSCRIWCCSSSCCCTSRLSVAPTPWLREKEGEGAGSGNETVGCVEMGAGSDGATVVCCKRRVEWKPNITNRGLGCCCFGGCFLRVVGLNVYV